MWSKAVRSLCQNTVLKHLQCNHFLRSRNERKTWVFRGACNYLTNDNSSQSHALAFMYLEQQVAETATPPRIKWYFMCTASSYAKSHGNAIYVIYKMCAYVIYKMCFPLTVRACGSSVATRTASHVLQSIMALCPLTPVSFNYIGFPGGRRERPPKGSKCYMTDRPWTKHVSTVHYANVLY